MFPSFLNSTPFNRRNFTVIVKQLICTSNTTQKHNADELAQEAKMI